MPRAATPTGNEALATLVDAGGSALMELAEAVSALTRMGGRISFAEADREGFAEGITHDYRTALAKARAAVAELERARPMTAVALLASRQCAPGKDGG